MRLLSILLALFIAAPRLLGQAVSGPSSATTNAVPSFQDNKHLKDNPLVTIVGGHLYINGVPVLTNAPTGVSISVNGTNLSSINLQDTTEVTLSLSGSNATFNIGAIAQSKVSGLVSDLTNKVLKAGDTMSAGGLTNRFDGFVGNGAGLTNIPQAGVSGLVSDLAAKQTGSLNLTNWSAIPTNGLTAPNFANIASNLFLAGPINNGAAAAPTFRVLNVSDFASGSGASSSTFWRGDGTWAAPAGNGTVTNVAVPSQFQSAGAGTTVITITLTNSTGTGKVVLDTDPALTRAALSGPSVSGNATNTAIWFGDHVITNSTTTPNPILRIYGTNVGGGTTQGGWIQIVDPGGGGTGDNLTLAVDSTGNPNLRLMDAQGTGHIGLNFSNTFNSSFAFKGPGSAGSSGGNDFQIRLSSILASGSADANSYIFKGGLTKLALALPLATFFSIESTNTSALALAMTDGTTFAKVNWFMDGSMAIGPGNVTRDTFWARRSAGVFGMTGLVCTNGVGSLATDAAVNIAATGWTNTFAGNASVYIDGTGLTFTIYNNAGTAVYTNAATVTHATALLQKSGKVIITAGTGVTGVAAPF